jgi:hypothetical protein
VKTELTGLMDDEMIQEMGHASQRFKGWQVRVTIEVATEEMGKKRKPKPPINHPSKNAPVQVTDLNGEEAE